MHEKLRSLLGIDTFAAPGTTHAVARNAREVATLALFDPAAEVRRDARYAIQSAARDAGVRPVSILPLYRARGRGEVPTDFTVPSINVRGMTFDVAAACFRAMKRQRAAAVVFELNRAEVAFTAQSPRDFATAVVAAGLAEAWNGPVFIQLDHLMANAAAYRADPEQELSSMEALIRAAVASGFYNIDIDASTLVDLSQPTVAAQQRPNVDVTARLAQFVRAVEPKGVEISVGGEIGEVGAHNSTEEELTAFVSGYYTAVGDGGPRLSKVSVQTGTRHGGVRLPDGGIADVALDFETLERLSKVCRERYAMAGAVQHGASTLPEELYPRFPAVGCAEIHLATGFQDAVLDHPAFPYALRAEMEEWTLQELANERATGETDVQFVRRARRKAWGPFRQRCWEIDWELRPGIFGDLEERFARLFGLLGVSGSADVVQRYVGP